MNNEQYDKVIDVLLEMTDAGLFISYSGVNTLRSISERCYGTAEHIDLIRKTNRLPDGAVVVEAGSILVIPNVGASKDNEKTEPSSDEQLASVISALVNNNVQEWGGAIEHQKKDKPDTLRECHKELAKQAEEECSETIQEALSYRSGYLDGLRDAFSECRAIMNDEAEGER